MWSGVVQSPGSLLLFAMMGALQQTHSRKCLTGVSFTGKVHQFSLCLQKRASFRLLARYWTHVPRFLSGIARGGT